MVVSEVQKLGGLAVLALCALYYGFSLALAGPSGSAVLPLSWASHGPGTVAVEISGGPAEGVYFIPEGSTLGFLSEMTGLPEGSESNRSLEEGALLAIFPAGKVVIGEISAAKKLALGLRLDVNRASAEELSLVPGISDRMAAEIVRSRRINGGFRDLSDLMAVSGIKEKRLKALRNYLTIKRVP